MKTVQRLVAVGLAIAVLVGCAAPVERPAKRPLPPSVVAPLPPSAPVPRLPSALTRLPADRLPAFVDDMDWPSLAAAIEKSLRYYQRVSKQSPSRDGGAPFSIDRQRETLVALREILGGGASEAVKRRRIAETFDVYQSMGSDGKNTVLFTGYFEPILSGSLVRTERFRYPIYRKPDDIVRVDLGRFRSSWEGEELVGRVHQGELFPYHSRGEIEDRGVLGGRDLEIVWVDDRIALFFLHIQGSGKIRLPGGRLIQVGYAARNGRPYRSLARFLVQTGRIDAKAVSYQALKRYLKEHPDELSILLGHNENFIFFRQVGEGPVGALGEILTAGRSIATDPSLFPRGGLAFIRLRKPVLDAAGEVIDWRPFSRFVLNQDTGAAIKGAGRVDLFCGTGDEAEVVAGSLKERGELYFLVKKDAAGQGEGR